MGLVVSLPVSVRLESGWVLMLMLMAKSAMIDGYPIKDATHIALETTRQFLEQDDSVRRLFFPNRTDLHTGLDPTTDYKSNLRRVFKKG